MYWRIYCKMPGRKRFYPLGEDFEGTYGPQANLLCAAVYHTPTDVEYGKLVSYVAQIKELNPDSELELRKVKF